MLARAAVDDAADVILQRSGGHKDRHDIVRQRLMHCVLVHGDFVVFARACSEADAPLACVPAAALLVQVCVALPRRKVVRHRPVQRLVRKPSVAPVSRTRAAIQIVSQRESQEPRTQLVRTSR